MQRRDFFIRLLGGVSVLPTVPQLWAAALPVTSTKSKRRHRPRAPQPHEDPKLARVGVSTWSFHRYFESANSSKAVAPGDRLVLMDFPEMIADRYHVHNLEFITIHFASLEPTYLEELKGKLLRARSKLVNIPVDAPEIYHEGGFSDPDARIRADAIEASKKWIDIAKKLGARSVRCDPGKMNLADLSLTVDSYRKLAAYGRSKGIDVLIENHGPIGTAHPEALVKLFKAVGTSFLGALPDFGNFPDEATRLRGLPMLFPYAKTVCHAKGLEFDAADNETKFNFARCVEISKQAKYHGVYSIEYEGSGDPYAGVQKVVDELVRFL
jgi:sugar phosphate isomerase/epimerase